MARQDTRTNPFPQVDWSKVKDRGDAAENASRKQHDKDLEHVERLHRRGEGGTSRDD